ncbi:hypothetical protein [Methylobrevis pamukkalensis]|uniref:Uncharacterized protein n=1 Tax=Methylobrevis pamukkalensis TaxID=1439726 RepID=A0A1E3H460_9HYPH|nr:hypothetical protein [Methylobrevis pamukkalensis]ODN71137.1 hypothetical protein A6302_01509 [Methylobrevis pamukkalensis]
MFPAPLCTPGVRNRTHARGTLVRDTLARDTLARIGEIHARRGRVGDLDERCRHLLIAVARRDGRIGRAVPVADFVEPLHRVAARHVANSRLVRDVAGLSALVVFSTMLALVAA